MILRLYRTYHSAGVNGRLWVNDTLLCHTIELPWRQNQPMISCIPEGTYVLAKRWSARYGWHLHVTGVKGRSLILIHPANDAARELKGCIAPVSTVTGPGKGLQSRLALDRLTDLVFPVITRQLTLLVISEEGPIVSPLNQQHESHHKTEGTNPQVFPEDPQPGPGSNLR